MKITTAVFSILAIMIAISGFAYFAFVDESDSKLIKNEIKNLDNLDDKQEEERGYLPVFAFIGLLVAICWVLRGVDKKKKEKLL